MESPEKSPVTEKNREANMEAPHREVLERTVGAVEREHHVLDSRNSRMGKVARALMLMTVLGGYAGAMPSTAEAGDWKRGASQEVERVYHRMEEMSEREKQQRRRDIQRELRENERALRKAQDQVKEFDRNAEGVVSTYEQSIKKARSEGESARAEQLENELRQAREEMLDAYGPINKEKEDLEERQKELEEEEEKLEKSLKGQKIRQFILGGIINVIQRH